MESEKIIMLALALIGIYFVGRFYFGKPVKKPARTYQIIHLPLTDQYIVKHRGKYIRTEYNLCRLDELFFADKYRTEAEAKKEIETAVVETESVAKEIEAETTEPATKSTEDKTNNFVKFKIFMIYRR